MKTPLLLLLLLLTLIVIGSLNQIFAQDRPSTVIAVFKGNKLNIEKAIESNTLSFGIKNLDTNSKTFFENKAENYMIPLISVAGDGTEKNVQYYNVIFEKKVEMKKLNRLFVSTGIKQIEFDGELMSCSDFFAPYMNASLIEK